MEVMTLRTSDSSRLRDKAAGRLLEYILLSIVILNAVSLFTNTFT